MNIYELQDYFVTEIATGNPDDFLVNLDQNTLAEEFSRLLFVWSQNRSDASKLQTAMSNEIAAMVCRATESMDADEIEYTADDIRREAEDRAYHVWKDRI